MKKLLVAALVVLLAAGASFAYDTKIIDLGTNLKNLPSNVRPISHVLSGDEKPSNSELTWIKDPFNRDLGPGERYGKRAIGKGWTIQDNISNDVFFYSPTLHRVGVRSEKNDKISGHDTYIVSMDVRLTDCSVEINLGSEGCALRTTAVWRGIPMMTGSLMKLCPTVCDDDELGCLGQGWSGDINFGRVEEKINPWNPRSGKYSDGPYVNRDRTPTSADIGENSPDFYGFAVPRIEARHIANALFANPGTNNNIDYDGDPFQPCVDGQETMTSVFLWSADRLAGSSYDYCPACGDADTVAVMVRLDNDLYKGMKVGDLNVIDVKGWNKCLGEWQGAKLARVESDALMGSMKFAIVHRKINEDDETFTDRVMTADEVILADDRGTGDCPTCDDEWKYDQYFALIGVKKGDKSDVACAEEEHKAAVAGLHIIVGERPFVKTPNLRCGDPCEAVQRFGWVYGNRPNAAQRCDGFTRDPFVNDKFLGKTWFETKFSKATLGTYESAVKDVWENWNEMYFVQDSVVEALVGSAPVFKLPAVRACDVPEDEAAIVMFTIRVGGGEMEIAADEFYGKTPADISVFDPVTGDEFTQVHSFGELCDNQDDARFAIVKPYVNDKLQQVMVGVDEEFVEDGVYYVALAVKNDSEYDYDYYKPTDDDSNNKQVWFAPAFLTFGAGPAPVVPGVEITAEKNTMVPNEMQRLTAAVVNVDEDAEFEFAWEVTDGEALVVTELDEEDETGATLKVTSVAVGTFDVTCTATNVDDEDEVYEDTITITIEAQGGGGGSGGGCSVGFAPAAALLLAPLFVLLKK